MALYGYLALLVSGSFACAGDDALCISIQGGPTKTALL